MVVGALFRGLRGDGARSACYGGCRMGSKVSALTGWVHPGPCLTLLTVHPDLPRGFPAGMGGCSLLLPSPQPLPPLFPLAEMSFLQSPQAGLSLPDCPHHAHWLMALFFTVSLKFSLSSIVLCKSLLFIYMFARCIVLLYIYIYLFLFFFFLPFYYFFLQTRFLVLGRWEPRGSCHLMGLQAQDSA